MLLQQCENSLQRQKWVIRGRELAAKATLTQHMPLRYLGEPLHFHRCKLENVLIGFEYKIRQAAIIRV